MYGVHMTIEIKSSLKDLPTFATRVLFTHGCIQYCHHSATYVCCMNGYTGDVLFSKEAGSLIYRLATMCVIA